MRRPTVRLGPMGLAIVTAALVGCAAPSEADEGVRVVEITIDGYHFVPDQFSVRQGETVRFEVSNPDRIGHELFIGTIAEQADRRAAMPTAPAEAEGGTRFGYGLYLPSLERGSFEYHFSSEDDLLIGCHLPGHWEEGMVATIEVEP